jgi:hypothetical protein
VCGGGQGRGEAGVRNGTYCKYISKKSVWGKIMIKDCFHIMLVVGSQTRQHQEVVICAFDNIIWK